MSGLPKIPGSHVLVVGDIILDRHVWGRVTRISPEAPVPVLCLGDGEGHQKDSLGGAANVASKIVELGGSATLAGLVGHDKDGGSLLDMASRAGVCCTGCVIDLGRVTTVKTRFIAHEQQVLRVDREVTDPPPEDVRERLHKRVSECLPNCAAMVIEDYGKGAATREIIELVVASGKPVVVDPCGVNWERYQGVALVTPNSRELLLVVGRDGDGAEDVEEIILLTQELIAETGIGAAAVTCGSAGIVIVTPKMGVTVAVKPIEVYDVTGAGDVVAATFALGLAAQMELAEIAKVANEAGRLVVQQLGVGSLRRSDA